MEIQFSKMSGNGNDFIIIDNRDGKFSSLYKNEFIEKIKLIENKKALYIFSLDNRVEEYELDGITNYKVEAIPQKIYDLYRKLVKLSKEN